MQNNRKAQKFECKSIEKQKSVCKYEKKLWNSYANARKMLTFVCEREWKLKCEYKCEKMLNLYANTRTIPKFVCKGEENVEIFYKRKKTLGTSIHTQKKNTQNKKKYNKSLFLWSKNAQKRTFPYVTLR